MQRFIAVIGGGDAQPAGLEVARQVGREIAQAGYSLVCGGLAGVMQAAAQGFGEGRGDSPGIALGLLPGDHAESANPYIDVAVPTGIGIGRNLLVVRTAVAVIVVGGSSGTLSELAFAWQLGRPVVAVAGTGGVADAWAGKPIDGRRSDHVMEASSAAQAEALAIDALAAG